MEPTSDDARRASVLLLVDGAVNLALGVLLLARPATAARALGVPPLESGFYASILGAVLFGIGVALLLEWRIPRGGLGLLGAVTINVSGGVVLAGWLVTGGLGLPVRGRVFLWTLVALLLGLSGFELARARKRTG